MNRVVGSVAVKESGTGVPGLLVVVYDLDPQVPPEEILGARTGSRSAELWQRLQGDRLGSVLTDEQGRFSLAYDDAEFRIRDDEKRPDLLVMVVAPEDTAEDSCPRVLHVSCGIRQNAGRIESYAIRIAAAELEAAGIPVPAVAPERPGPKVADLVSEMKAVAEERQRRRPAERKAFSKRYRDQWARARRVAEASGRVAPPPQSVAVDVPIIVDRAPLPAEARTEFDRATGRLMVRMNAQAPAQAFDFGGVQHVTASGERGVQVTVDRATRQFSIQVPRSPYKLVAPDDGSARLARWYRRHEEAAPDGPDGAGPG
jgi:hypothetical protein